MANRRIALLVATDSYADPEFTDLRTPCTDASALASLLGDPAIGAFEVTTLLNRPAQDVRDLLEDTFAEASRDDLVLLHLSGHGLKDEAGKLQLILSDTRRNRLRSSAVAASWVRELIDHSAARRVVVWLDCCFSGAFPPGFRPKGTETVDAIDQLAGDSGRGCAVMTASTKVQYAFEKEQSVFTEAIMSGLRTGAADLNEDGLVDASELYSYVYDWVRTRSPGQTPTRNDMLSGDFYIAYNRNTLQLPLELPAELRGLLKSSNPLLKDVGVRTLREMAEAGDQAARRALATMGEQSPAEAPVRVPVVVDVPQPLTARLRRIASPDFRFMRDIRMKKRISCALFDAREPGRLCVASADGEARWVHAFDGGSSLGSFIERGLVNSDVRTIALSPDGTLLARAGHSRTAVFNRWTMEMIVNHDGLAYHLAFSPDSQVLAGTDYEQVTLWSLGPAQQVHYLETAATCLAFNPDGTLTTGHDRLVVFWDLLSGSPTSTVAHPSAVSAIAYRPEFGWLVTGDDNGVIWTSGVDGTWHPIASGQHQTAVVSVSFDENGVMATASDDGHIMFWEPN